MCEVINETQGDRTSAEIRRLTEFLDNTKQKMQRNVHFSTIENPAD